jgi:hypothetical protein
MEGVIFVAVMVDATHRSNGKKKHNKQVKNQHYSSISTCSFLRHPSLNCFSKVDYNGALRRTLHMLFLLATN